MNQKGLKSLFIQYLEGSISKENLQYLEKLLEKDFELRKELEMHLELKEVLSDVDIMDFREWIYHIINTTPKEGNSTDENIE